MIRMGHGLHEGATNKTDAALPGRIPLSTAHCHSCSLMIHVCDPTIRGMLPQ